MEINKFPRKRIGEILIEEGVLEPGNLEKALEIQKREGGLIGSILVRMGWVSEENLVLALSKQLSIPFIQLSGYMVNGRALQLISKDIAELYLVFPFEKDNEKVSFAMADPLNAEAREVIERKAPLPIQIFLATVSDIRHAIQFHYEERAENRTGAK